ncbi:MAG: hypothetical protein RLZZ574_2277, partial [Cyanobacteriota bacterium]
LMVQLTRKVLKIIEIKTDRLDNAYQLISNQ